MWDYDLPAAPNLVDITVGGGSWAGPAIDLNTDEHQWMQTVGWNRRTHVMLTPSLLFAAQGART